MEMEVASTVSLRKPISPMFCDANVEKPVQYSVAEPIKGRAFVGRAAQPVPFGVPPPPCGSVNRIAKLHIPNRFPVTEAGW